MPEKNINLRELDALDLEFRKNLRQTGDILERKGLAVTQKTFSLREAALSRRNIKELWTEENESVLIDLAEEMIKLLVRRLVIQKQQLGVASQIPGAKIETKRAGIVATEAAIAAEKSALEALINPSAENRIVAKMANEVAKLALEKLRAINGKDTY